MAVTARALAAEGYVLRRKMVIVIYQLVLLSRKFVTIADLDEVRGQEIAKELSPFVDHNHPGQSFSSQFNTSPFLPD